MIENKDIAERRLIVIKEIQEALSSFPLQESPKKLPVFEDQQGTISKYDLANQLESCFLRAFRGIETKEEYDSLFSKLSLDVDPDRWKDPDGVFDKHHLKVLEEHSASSCLQEMLQNTDTLVRRDNAIEAIKNVLSQYKTSAENELINRLLVPLLQAFDSLEGKKQRSALYSELSRSVNSDSNSVFSSEQHEILEQHSSALLGQLRESEFSVHERITLKMRDIEATCLAVDIAVDITVSYLFNLIKGLVFGGNDEFYQQLNKIRLEGNLFQSLLESHAPDPKKLKADINDQCARCKNLLLNLSPIYKLINAMLSHSVLYSQPFSFLANSISAIFAFISSLAIGASLLLHFLSSRILEPATIPFDLVTGNDYSEVVARKTLSVYFSKRRLYRAAVDKILECCKPNEKNLLPSLMELETKEKQEKWFSNTDKLLMQNQGSLFRPMATHDLTAIIEAIAKHYLKPWWGDSATLMQKVAICFYKIILQSLLIVGSIACLILPFYVLAKMAQGTGAILQGAAFLLMLTGLTVVNIPLYAFKACLLCLSGNRQLKQLFTTISQEVSEVIEEQQSPLNSN